MLRSLLSPAWKGVAIMFCLRCLSVCECVRVSVCVSSYSCYQDIPRMDDQIIIKISGYFYWVSRTNWLVLVKLRSNASDFWPKHKISHIFITNWDIHQQFDIKMLYVCPQHILQARGDIFITFSWGCAHMPLINIKNTKMYIAWLLIEIFTWNLVCSWSSYIHNKYYKQEDIIVLPFLRLWSNASDL